MSQPTLALSSRRDQEFTSSVHALLVDDTDPAALRARFRRTYRLRSFIDARSAEDRVEIRYLYRDGRWTPDMPAGGEMHDDA